MAAMTNARHYGQQHPPRPPIQPQHSSSVPSTPSQQPRERRFRSTSPSPNRRLDTQSPTSMASEPPAGPTNVQRGAPVVCKFETGAEIRKRRIPYVEGGNEELGPPKKEPKKTLQPDERDKLSGDMRELYDRLLPSEESEERRGRLVKKLEKLLNDEWPGHDIRVNVFGSSGNLLSSSDSDVDICITTPLKKLESMHSLAGLLHKHGMEKVVCRASAKVPIVKCWDPELKLACDLNVNNPLALENTRMIKTYVQLDERVRPLAKIIKYWTKRRILNDAAFGGTISSYTWICMILSFLQRREPPILPSLQKAQYTGRSGERSETRRFADDVEALRGCGDANQESLAELLFQFFRHYGYEFKYSEYVVSVKEGRLLSRKEKGWETSNYLDKEARNRLCVEEPFTTNRNLGNSADDYAWSGIHKEIRRAFELLADGKLGECCEQYEFPPEEKPIFHKPAPKPAPTLRRSASQSGRPNHEPGSGRSRKGGNRNQSAQRAGNRRASSGASFSNQRVPLPSIQSPPVGANAMDYFATKGNLHDALYQQYQYLQAQQDALRSQLAHHAQQQQQQGQGQQHRVGDLAASPHQMAFVNGLPSPRYLDPPPQIAPLLPGYLYHYPARYPPPSPMSQARSREGGTSTNPSSPSLVAAVPALRRQVHRASVTAGSSSSSMRSQSQPGRSLPHPLTLQQQAHPGYDVSGAIQYQNVRSAQQMYGHGPPQGMPLPFSPITAMHPTTAGLVDSAMPKEYVGYYVGQSPQLGPQCATAPAAASQAQMPPMTLRDPPPQRQRRVTPDLMPPAPNGRHSSRSPSPLGHGRKFSMTAAPLDLRPALPQHQLLASPTMLDQAVALPLPPLQAIAPAATGMDVGGPLIVNGSNPSVRPKSVVDRVNEVPPDISSTHHEQKESQGSETGGRMSQRTLSLRTVDLDKQPEQIITTETAAVAAEKPPSSPRVADTNSRTTKTSGPHRLSFSPNGTVPTQQQQNVIANGGPESSPHTTTTTTTTTTAPLLSPVAELRTPSPTRPHAFEKQESPRANGLVHAAKIANAKQAERNMTGANENFPLASQHERKGSAPNAARTTSPLSMKAVDTSSKPGSVGRSPTLSASATEREKEKASPNANIVNANPWLQATRKGHKKSKSLVMATSGNINGQPMSPAGESERKGG